MKIVESHQERNQIRIVVDVGADVPREITGDEVYGGLSMPSATSPGYAVWVMRERDLKIDTHRYWYTLVHELQIDSVSANDLYTQLASGAFLTKCSTIFADLSGPGEEVVRAYHEFCYHKRTQYGSMADAFLKDNKWLSVSLIRDAWNGGLLQLPHENDSPVVSQLREVRKSDLPNLEEAFFAVDAMRHALAAFHVETPIVAGGSMPHYTSSQAWLRG